MRISTNTLYQSGVTQIGNLQSEQSKLQQQIATGKRLLSAADDPVAAAQALAISSAQGINQKYADSRQTAQIKLNTIESSLTTITNLMVATQSSLVGAGNGSYSDGERKFIATELSNRLESMIGLSNSKDTNGKYLYAGYKTDTVPFVATASGANYVGDSNTQLIQVDTQRQMASNVTGNSVFQAGSDVFQTMSDLVTLLNTPITDDASRTAFTTGLATGLKNMGLAVDNVLNVRASVGDKLNEIDALDADGSSRDLQYTTALSGLQDLDYAKALSDLSKQQTIMEAAQKSFVIITGLSLFNFM
jgi:flagellar hook-associated protein 3 FlgL